MKKIKFFAILLLLTFFNFNATAQNAGDNDPTFNPTDIGFGYGDGAGNEIVKSILQNDGKLIIVGRFTSYNSTVCNRIARVNHDGSLDTTFNVGLGANNDVLDVVIQTDGKIIIVGDFTTFNGLSRNYIVRLNSDGSIDNTFSVGTGFNITAITVLVLPDDKILVGGGFSYFNGIYSRSIVRLNSDGTLDYTFNSLSHDGSSVSRFLLLADDKVLVAGDFNTFNSLARRGIVRLNADLTFDSIFNTGTGPNLSILCLNQQLDGKILVGGDFLYFNGILKNCIVRLDSLGVIDNSFISSGINNTPSTHINTINIQPNGKIVVGGLFTTFNGLSQINLVRLNSDGSKDNTFNVGSGPDYIINSVNIQSDGKIIITGHFNLYNNVKRVKIARLFINGSLDLSFQGGTGSDWTILTKAIQIDGKILVGGAFSYFNGIAKKGFVRLNVDGSIDNTFNMGSGSSGSVSSIVIQPDDKILFGGWFTSYNGTSRNRIARVNSDGTIDASFNTGTGANGQVKNIAIQPDGKIVVAGDFTTFNSVSKNRITRLNSDGSIDATFNIGTGANSYITSIAIQPDGKIIVAGDFTTFNSVSKNRITRLNSDGSIDATFNIGTGANNYITTIAIQPDGKILIGGYFTTYNSATRKYNVRLNTDGTIDGSFASGTSINNLVNTIVLQSDGYVMLGGLFNTLDGSISNYIVRLDSIGSVVSNINFGSGPNNEIYSITNTGSKILVGGKFTSYKGIGRNRIARLYDCSVSVGTDVQVACNSFTWIDGNTYTTSTNTPTFTIIDGAISGCDSVVSLNLTINATSSFDTIVSCDPITWIDGNTYSTSTNTPTFILTNAVGCDSVVNLNLTINNLIASYNSIDNTNGNYTFTNTSTGTFNQTHWAFGDGTTSTAANPSHTFSANGTYVVVLTVNDSTSSSCMDYYLDTIVVTSVVAPLQCAAGFVMYPDAGNVTVVNSSTGTNLTYLWDFGDGSTSTLQFPTHTYATTDNYYLCLTIDDGAGCVDMYCDSIGENGVVFNKQTGFTINVIAPPLATQVSEQVAIISTMSIFPNPTGKKLHVVFNKSEPYQLKIVAIDGKLIETKTIVGNTTLDVSKYSSGMYFITATNNEGEVYQSKFVKE